MKEKDARRYLKNALICGYKVYQGAYRTFGPLETWDDMRWNLARDLWPEWFEHNLLLRLQVALQTVELTTDDARELCAAFHRCTSARAHMSHVGLVPGPGAIPANWGEGLDYTATPPQVR